MENWGTRTPGPADCNLPLAAGIPAICIGLADGGAHTTEEYLLPGGISSGLAVAGRLPESCLPVKRNGEPCLLRFAVLACRATLFETDWCGFNK